MGAHLKLGRPLMVEVHGSEDPLKFDDLDEVCHSGFGAVPRVEGDMGSQSSAHPPCALLWLGSWCQAAFSDTVSCPPCREAVLLWLMSMGS